MILQIRMNGLTVAVLYENEKILYVPLWVKAYALKKFESMKGCAGGRPLPSKDTE